MRGAFQALFCTFLVISTLTSGCFGDDDNASDYDGPIDLVVYYDITNGTIQKSINNGQQGTTTGVDISFDLATTSSTAGAIVTITLSPDDGSQTIEQNVGEDGAEISYTYMTHGLFEANVGAIDSEGNTHTVQVKIRIDEKITSTANNVNNENTMVFNATSDCTDGIPQPNRIEVSSLVENPNSGSFVLGGGDSEVTWSLNNAENEVISSNSGTIGDGQNELWETTSLDVTVGNWELKITNDGDEVDIDQEVSILYLEGSESPPLPRP